MPSPGKVALAYAIYKAREALVSAGMSEEDAEKLTDLAEYGPGILLGTELTGAVSMFDFYGNTFAEQVGNTVLGPGLGSLGKAGYKSAAGKDPTSSLTPMGRQIDSLMGRGEVTIGSNKKRPMTALESFLGVLNFPALDQTKYYDQRDLPPEMRSNLSGKRQKREVRAKREKRETR
jgi:hypothetical protein